MKNKQLKTSTKATIKPRRVIIALFGDTHGGHRLALMNPAVTLFQEDEKGNLEPYEPKLTKSQRYLWECYEQDIEAVKKLAGGDEIIPIHNGDLTQGNKHKSELVSDRMANQMIIATENMKPWMELPNVKTMLISVGTEAHNFGLGSSEILVREQLQAIYRDKHVKLMYHGSETINGVRVDFAHHGPQPGSRNWLKGNVARFYLRDLMWEEIKLGNPPPELVCRAHYHQFVYEILFEGDYTSRLILTPSYMMLDDHASKVTQSRPYIQHGLVAFEIVDGRLSEPYKFMRRIDVRRKESL